MSSFDPQTGDLFRHVSAEKAPFYRAIMNVFAAAKRQYRLHLRPDEVLVEADWAGQPPSPEELQSGLAQLADWGNLQAQPDTGRKSRIEDYYRARFIYRLSVGGEAVETALDSFAQALHRRSELQSVALEDICHRLDTLLALRGEADATKVHEVLRDLARVFQDLAENAQSFMAGVARSIDMQQADVTAVLAYKARLIEYLERFIGDLVSRSGAIAQRILQLQPHIDGMLWLAASREARDAAPDASGELSPQELRLREWQERWQGLRLWFISEGHRQSQAELLRSRARAAIPNLLNAVALINERRSGRSDRSADFRILARWFAECSSEDDAHRLWRAAFALNSARHLSLVSDAGQPVSAGTSWRDATPIMVSNRLRERGEIAPRGPAPKVQERSVERELLARQLAEERLQVEAARQRLATGEFTRLSQLGGLDRHAFRLFLNLLGEALTAQVDPDQPVSRTTGDGLMHISLEPLANDSWACIETDDGLFCGRDHVICIRPLQDTP